MICLHGSFTQIFGLGGGSITVRPLDLTPVTRHRGTDSRLHKGGDYFGVAASRSAELRDTST
jgi:hypothetical protein